MASGLPVIATAVGGNADLVDDGRTGVVVPASDVEAMAGQIVALASAPERAKALGQAGRQRVVERFSLKAMVAAYQSVYDQQLRRTSATQQDN